jgi:pyruvate dehydrogenase E1 component alpha subunit
VSSSTKTTGTGRLSKYKKDFLHKLVYDMLIIRRFEEKAAQMYGLRKIGGFCHLYNGQEAVAVGAVAALDLVKDYLLTGYRDHGHALACGMEPNSIMAELFGKVTGSSKGKGGSMHLFDAERHFLGGNGIVGAQIPIATGVAYASMYRKDKGVVLCFFGDGAIHQGAYHESLNLAKIWNLPIVYMCENNQFGMGTNFKRVSAVTDFSLMAGSYGISGKQLDGMDVISVYEGVLESVGNARKNGKPEFIEIKTYRYKGHSMSDPAKYRTKEELEAYKKQDPILMFKAELLKNKLITEGEYGEFDATAKARVQEAVNFAEESDQPEIESMYEDILTGE